jgi:hypothetical protein
MQRHKITGLAAAIAAAALVTACGSSAPSGQPGASPPPSAACLAQGTCTAAQQQQVAASNGITNPDGLNGCLVAGDCTASQQQGIAAGTSATGNSPAAPAPSSPASGTAMLDWTCNITSANPANSTEWTTSFKVTATNYTQQTVDITNGPTVTFADQSGDDTDSYPVVWVQDIQPGSSASYVGSDYITSPTSAPTSCSVTQWS